MKFKVGDEVRFNSGFDVGLGTVVAVNIQRTLYLVHSDDIKWGHNGGSHENDIYLQDNRNNWWFRETQLSLVGENK